MIEDEFKKSKLRDIKAIEFTENTQEILTSMEIILTMYQIDDDKDIVFACKNKLLEGVEKLKKLGLDSDVEKFNIK